MARRSRYHRIQYDSRRVLQDLADRGWLPIDLSRNAQISVGSISLFLNGKRQTPRTALAIAQALGRRTTRRYALKTEVA